jgi:NAD(P)-dependent dehydrogenase (short-subunit alcohol dehydrogenase family)
VSKPTVIVSGGTYGIGRATSLLLAERGYAVYGFGIDLEQAEGATALAQKRGLDTAFFDVGDVRDPEFVDALVRRVTDEHAHISALVNNAAIRVTGTILDAEPPTWESLFSVNVTGPYLLSRSVLPAMLANGRGAIVNVLSGAAHGKPDLFVYSATKGALLSMTKSMALDFAASRIRVNGVVPGPTVTGMNEDWKDIEERKRRYGARSAAGRMNTPEDVAAAIAWLLSSESENVTGTVLEVGTLPSYAQ